MTGLLFSMGMDTSMQKTENVVIDGFIGLDACLSLDGFGKSGHGHVGFVQGSGHVGLFKGMDILVFSGISFNGDSGFQVFQRT